MRRIVDFVSGFATNVTLEAVKVVTEAIRDRLPSALATDRLKVDGSGVTQPVSGTVAISGTPTISGAVTVTSGAITETNSADILAKITANAATAALQGAGLPAALGAGGGVKVDGSGTALPVSGSVTATISGTPAVTVSSGSVTAAQGTAAAAGAPWFVRLSDGAAAIAVALDSTVAAMSAKLPAALGQAARAASMSVGLSTEDAAKVPALGQATAANSVPVVLTAIQIAQLAQDATLTGGTQIAIAKGAAAAGAAVSGNPVYVGGKDGSGNAQPFLVNASGVAQTSMAKGTSVSSTAAEASHVISASACLVSRIAMQNASASTRYCQAHNTTSLPSNGAVPVAVIIIGTTQTQVMTFNIPTDRFSTGCVVATSSTGGTLTIGSADALFQVDLFPTNV